MTKQISSNWTPTGMTGSATTSAPNSTNDADLIDTHMNTVEANAPADVNVVTTMWSGLDPDVVTERETGETKSGMLRRHEIKCKAAATTNPIPTS